MRKALMLYSRPPRTDKNDAQGHFEVSLLKKFTRYDVDAEMPAVIEHEWVYSTIVMADSPGLAVYVALHEYFTGHLARKWQKRTRPLSSRQLTLVDLFANDLAESVMCRFGTASEVIHAIVTPWEPSCITLHFEASR